MVEIVYKFDEKSTMYVLNGKSAAKVPFKLFGVTYLYTYIICIHINGHQPNHINPSSCMRMRGNYIHKLPLLLNHDA